MPGSFVRIVAGKLLQYIARCVYYEDLLTTVAAKGFSQGDRSQPTTPTARTRIISRKVNLVGAWRLHRQVNNIGGRMAGRSDFGRDLAIALTPMGNGITPFLILECALSQKRPLRSWHGLVLIDSGTCSGEV